MLSRSMEMLCREGTAHRAPLYVPVNAAFWPTGTTYGNQLAEARGIEEASSERPPLAALASLCDA